MTKRWTSNWILALTHTSKPDSLKNIIIEARRVLLSFEPLLEETIKWNIPFYTCKGKSVCYLSTKAGKNFVQVAFIRVFDLENEWLVAAGRTVIRALEFTSFGVEEDSRLSLLVTDVIALNGNN